MSDAAIDEALRRRFPAADAKALALAAAWARGAVAASPDAGGATPPSREAGLGALGALPPDAALALVDLDDAPAPRRAEVRRLVLAALAADPFRAPDRPLSPAAEAAIDAGQEIPGWLAVAEGAAPILESLAASAPAPAERAHASVPDPKERGETNAPGDPKGEEPPYGLSGNQASIAGAPRPAPGPLAPAAPLASAVPRAVRPVVLLARGGGFAALGGLFEAPPLLAPGPEDPTSAAGGCLLLAYDPSGRVALLRLHAGGAEVVSASRIEGLVAAGWHPQRGLIWLSRDGRLASDPVALSPHGARAPVDGGPLAERRFGAPARIHVAAGAVLVHTRDDLRLHRVEADGRVRPAMDESASALALDAGGHVIALLRGPRRPPAGPGKKAAGHSHRLARVTASGPETIAAIEGEGEVALLERHAFHVSAATGRLTVADLAGGAIRRGGALPGGEGVTSLVATRRALFVTTARSGHIRAYGPAPGALEPLPRGAAGEGAGGRVNPLVVPAGIAALAPGFAVLSSGEVLRIRGEAAEWGDAGWGDAGTASGHHVRPGASASPASVTFEAARSPILLGRAPRAATPTPEGGVIVAPQDGSPLLEVTPQGGVRPLPFGSAGVVALARAGRSTLVLGRADALVWIDLERGVLAEIEVSGLKALAPIGRHDVLALHDGGLERLTHPGPGVLIREGAPPVRGIGGAAAGAVAALSSGLVEFGPDGARTAEVALAINREPLVAVLGAGRALVVPRGGTEGFLWTT